MCRFRIPSGHIDRFHVGLSCTTMLVVVQKSATSLLPPRGRIRESCRFGNLQYPLRLCKNPKGMPRRAQILSRLTFARMGTVPYRPNLRQQCNDLLAFPCIQSSLTPLKTTRQDTSYTEFHPAFSENVLVCRVLGWPFLVLGIRVQVDTVRRRPTFHNLRASTVAKLVR